MKKDLLKTSLLMSAIVLVTVGAALLLNLLTGPKIAADKAYRDELAAQQAAGVLLEVFPGATGFEDITSTLTIDPASGVSVVHKEVSGKGYVFVASKTNSPMKGLVDVTVGVDKDGKITGVSVNFNHPDDYPVNDATLSSFIGQDSTLAGVEMTAKATVSSTTIKEATNAGFLVLAANNLMKAAEKDIELVFEELLSTVLTGFVTNSSSELTTSGNIYKALKSKNDTSIVCHVNSGDTKLLAIANVSGNVVVYKANLVDEATQTYELVDVTLANASVVAEVSAFAQNKISSKFTDLDQKIKRVYDDAETTDVVEVSDITEIAVKTQGCVSSAASFVYEGVTYYVYYVRPVNRFSQDPVMDIYVFIDGTGKIVRVDIDSLYFNAGYWMGKPSISEDEYRNGFVGLDTDTYDGSQSLITGATFSPNAVHEAIEAAFAEFATLGGNN